MPEQNLSDRTIPSLTAKRNVARLICLSWLTLIVVACGSSPATPDTQATIDAAVVATDTAQAANQATIEAAVEATGAAIAAEQATAEAAAQATNAAEAATEPTPEPTLVAADTPIPIEEAATLSEEELAALIDQAVTEAVLATEQYSTATEQAAADSTVTAEEIQTVEVYVSGAEEAIALAEELLTLYADLYGAEAAATVATIEEINQSLAELVEYTALMVAVLEEMNNAVEQGLELNEETIAELLAVAQAAGVDADQVQEQLQTWAASRPLPAGAAVEPNQVFSDPQGAAQSVFELVQAGQQATADGELSPQELAMLAQLGANAGASLNAQESAQLQQLAGNVEAVAAQLGAGNVAQLQEALGQLGVDTVGSMPPSQVAADLPGAMQMVRSFAKTGKQMTADGHVSGAELAALAQLAANANAGLNAHGGPQLQQLSGSIGDITGQLARGDVGQAQTGLKEFGASLDKIPDVDKPTLPEKPARNRN